MSNLLGPLLGGLLTVALGWRACWWALVPLAALAAIGIARLVPRLIPAEGGNVRPGLNRIVLGATLIAGLTFAVMIGAFYIAEQYLQRVAGFSALGASGALVLVALLVGAAAPLAGKLVDSYGEKLPAVIGFASAGLGLVILGIPGVSLDSAVTVLPLIPVGIGLGMLFVPDLARGAERDAAGGARAYLGRALGRAAAWRRGWRRAGGHRAVGDFERFDGPPCAAVRGGPVPAGRDPRVRAARRARAGRDRSRLGLVQQDGRRAPAGAVIGGER